MHETTNHEWAELLSAEPIPPEHNPIWKLMLGFLAPSEMTPGERMDELASILASAYLQFKAAKRVQMQDGMPPNRT